MLFQTSPLSAPPVPMLPREGLSAQFQWSDEFSVANPDMDDTHREFVACVAHLLAASDASQPEALDAFEAHARRHFAEEDEAIRHSGYAAAGCHVAEHAAILESTAEVRVALTEGRHSVVRAFARALADWFPEHARVMDQGLARFLDVQRLGGAPLMFRRATDAGSVRRVHLPECA